MLFRKTITLIILIFTVNSSWADLPNNYQPFAKYNSDKSYYFVSVPKSKYSSKEGYTAVFDSKTNQLQFKVDKYFSDYHIFLSDDGEQLIHVNHIMDTLIDSCFLTVYQKFSMPDKINVYRKNSQYVEEGLFQPNILDVVLKKGYLKIITEDSVYCYNFSDQSVVSSRNNSNFKMVEPYTQTGDYLNDSIFDISNLYLGKQSFAEKLADDFQFKTVEDKEKATKAIYFDLRISKNSQYTLLNIDVWKFPADKQFRPYPLTDLKEEILERIKTYNGLENNIPSGVDFWVYTGKMYVSD